MIEIGIDFKSVTYKLEFLFAVFTVARLTA